MKVVNAAEVEVSGPHDIESLRRLKSALQHFEPDPAKPRATRSVVAVSGKEELVHGSCLGLLPLRL